MPDAALDLSSAHLIHHGELQANTWRNYVPEEGAAADAAAAG